MSVTFYEIVTTKGKPRELRIYLISLRNVSIENQSFQSTLTRFVLAFESVDEMLKCDHSNESYWEPFPVVLFIMLYKVVLTFESVHEILKCDHSNESYWAVLSLVQGGSKIWLWMKNIPKFVHSVKGAIQHNTCFSVDLFVFHYIC